MSNQIVTDYFRLHNVNQFKESISETANSIYYVFASKSTPYANGDILVAPQNTVKQHQIDVLDEMVFGKLVNSSDVATMIPRNDWVANTKYDAYRDYIDLTDKQYFVCVNAISQFHIFKVLDNNNGSASQVSPLYEETSADDDYYQTSDGYVWKYMYTIPKDKFDKFATSNFIPVIPNANVQANSVSGAIDIVEVIYAGSHYNSYLSNTFVSTDLRVGGNPTKYAIANNASIQSGYYEGCYIYISAGTGAGQTRRITMYQLTGSQKVITVDTAFTVSPDITSSYEITPAVMLVGDGQGAIARAIVNAASSNSIARVEVVQRGNSYTWATANVVGATDGFTNTAVVSAVMGPKGGHGSNPEAELQGVNLGISVTFANTEGTTIPATNDYRTFGIIKDPLFANVVLSFSGATTFDVGERVYQQSTRAEGVISITDNFSYMQLSNVDGIFSTSANVVGYTSGATANVSAIAINGVSKGFDTFDQRRKLVYSVKTGTNFIEDEMLYQLDPAIANSFFHAIDEGSSTIYITNLKGDVNTSVSLVGSNSGAAATISSFYPPDLVHGSGEVIYIENMDPLTRSNTQSEVIKIILKF